MKYLPFVLVVLLFAVACKTIEPVVLKNKFNTSEAFSQMEPTGNNTIKGSAFVKLNNGGMVTCAGRELQLLPATAYAKERMMYLYGNTNRGFRHNYSRAVKFNSTDENYLRISRITVGDAQGYFEFENLKDGEYFLLSAISWMAGRSTENCVIMQRVEVTGGETKKVVLSQ